MISALLVGSLAGSALASPFFNPFFSPADPVSLFKRISSGCSTTGAASCSSSSVSNTCCTESPGGLLLQTQFWDTDPSTGPTNSWTIHGLWPDNCDGTFVENCDSSRDYTNISSLLTAQGASDTLDYMNTYWINDPNDGSNEEFWEHEWATHGTCMSTLVPSCLPSGSAKGAEAVAFYQTVVKLFKTLPTYNWLAAAGITPSSTRTYTLAAINAALESGSGGFLPQLSCTSSALGSISWYFNLKGSIIDGTFVPIAAPSAGSCPSSGIKYATKTGSPVGTSTSSSSTESTSTTTTTTTTSTGPTGTPGSIPAKGTITASSVGGLLSAGTWSTQTLATYTLTGTATSFTLKTSKGSCGVSGGVFSCGSSVSASTFSAVSSGSSILLAYSGSTAFSSSGTPSGSTVETVNTGSSGAETYTLTIVGS